jgi:hypothetical protein
LQKIQQRLAFGGVRMKRNVHRVAMVQPPAIVNRALAEDSDRQLAFERVGKEPLHLPRLAQVPTGSAGETNESRRAHQTLLRETEIFGDLLAGGLLDQHGCDLIVSARHLPSRVGDLLLCGRQRPLVFFKLRSGDESFSQQFL